MQSATQPRADFTSVSHRYVASGNVVQAAPASSSESMDTTSLEAEVQRLRAALDDIITFAHGTAECRHRVVQMQRRAMAALAGTDAAQEPAWRRG